MYYHSHLKFWKVYLYWRFYIYLEISVLGYQWRIDIIVIEIARGLGELKLISHPCALNIVANLIHCKCM